MSDWNKLQTNFRLVSRLEACSGSLSAMIQQGEDKLHEDNISANVIRSSKARDKAMFFDRVNDACKQAVEDLKRAEDSVTKLKTELREQQLSLGSSASLNYLCNLPHEVLFIICGRLNGRDLGSCRESCKALNDLLEPYLFARVALRTTDVPSNILLDIIHHFFARPVAKHVHTLKITENGNKLGRADGKTVQVSDLIFGGISAANACIKAAPTLRHLQHLFLEGHSRLCSHKQQNYALFDDWVIGRTLCDSLWNLKELTLKGMDLDIDGMGAFPVPKTVVRLVLNDVEVTIPCFDSMFSFPLAHGQRIRTAPEYHLALEELVIDKCRIPSLSRTRANWHRLLQPLKKVRTLKRVDITTAHAEVKADDTVSLALTKNLGPSISRCWTSCNWGRESFCETTWTWEKA